MKSNLLIQLLLAFLPLLSIGQQRWENLIEDNTKLFPAGNCISYDDGLFVISRKGGTGSKKIIFYKLDRNGDILWQKHLFYDDWAVPGGIKQSENGKIIVYGITNNDACLVMLDACGNFLWCNRYNESQNFTTDFTDAVFLDNGNVILLMTIDYNDGVHFDIGLISFDSEGNLLWVHPFNMIQKYPRLYGMIYTWHLEKHDNFLMLSGFGYYSYPDNPYVGLLKPMFVKTDADFNEEWLLPYGLADSSVNDTILGDARGVVSYENGILHGWGSSTKPLQSYYTSILMNFDTAGNVTNHHIIENEMIDSTATENFFLDLCKRDDTTYFTSIKYGNQGWENPSGEVIIDTAGNVYQSHSHTEANLQGGNFPLEKDTTSNQYYLTYSNYDWNIVLYKFDADLNSVPIDTASYNYDSLCDNLPIASDTIYVTDCGVIVSTPEFPTPAAYYAAKQKVELTAYPNPVNGNMVHFKLKYTQYHSNMQLTVYDISGRPMAKKPIATGQKEAQLSVNGFSPGLYVAVISNGKKVLGKRAFAVE